MDIVTIIIVAVITVGLHLALAWWYKKSGTADGSQQAVIKDRLDRLNRRLDKSSDKMQQTVESQLKDSRSVIKNITKEISAVKETNKDVLDLTESLSDLETVLKNQKSRGSLGEASLELVLENILPPTAFELQYKLDSGTRPDAVIFAKDSLIAVDAKFPLSNYQKLVGAEDEKQKEQAAGDFKKDLKARIDETAKYASDDEEQTLGFALMYIPAEGIYYDLLTGEVGAAGSNTRNLIEYAQEKNVIIVSPTTLAAYLHTILEGMRAFQIEQNAEQIQKGIDELRTHLKAYEDLHEGLGKNLNAVVNKYNDSNVKLRGIARDIRQVTDGDFQLDADDIDNPQTGS